MKITRSCPDVGNLDPAVLVDNNLAQVVRADNFVFLSGVVAVNKKGECVARGDMAGQLQFVVESIAKLLATEKMSFANIVATTTYTTDMQALMQHGRNLTDAFVGHPPTSTYVGVKELASPDFLVEIAVTAAG